MKNEPVNVRIVALFSRSEVSILDRYVKSYPPGTSRGQIIRDAVRKYVFNGSK